MNTLKQREGYALELDKKYSVIIRVTGDFNTMKWWFTMKPKSNGEFEFSNPVSSYSLTYREYVIYVTNTFI